MPYQVEDPGIQVHGDRLVRGRYGCNPRNDHEVALFALSMNGFVVIDPAERRARHVTPADRQGGGGAIGQRPGGPVYHLVSRYSPAGDRDILYRWDWTGTVSEPVVELPDAPLWAFTLDVARDGRIYLPAYHRNTMFRYDPASGAWENLGDFAEFGNCIWNVYCAADGWVYVTATDHHAHRVVAMEPGTGRRFAVRDAHGEPVTWQYGMIQKDGAGRVFGCQACWGREAWMELVAGQVHAVDPFQPRLACTRLDMPSAETGRDHSPFAFRDGSYLSWLRNDAAGCRDAEGREIEIPIRFKGSPLRAFSVVSGGDRIWAGTILPLVLLSYCPATGKTASYGNPTDARLGSSGEIYSMVWSRDKLYMASYPRAVLTRYDSAKPWKPDRTPSANPAHLGLMKEEGLPLQRIYGAACAPDGTVFFAAHGGYGCEDSGICRINPDTELVTRWIYHDAMFSALCYLPGFDQLLVGEYRKGETGYRFTFVSPETGKALHSAIVVESKCQITSWLFDGEAIAYGHNRLGDEILAFDVARRKITGKSSRIGLGSPCYNMLVFGPDKRIWGLTNQCVFALARDLAAIEKVCDYPDHADGGYYRFGMVYGPDGNLYFPNGDRLMRLPLSRSGAHHE